MRSRVVFPLAALLTASAWCVALLLLRKHRFGAVGYDYLAWNLMLAWIPFLIAILLVIAYRRRHSTVELLAVGAAWLLFLPNAPYVLTDFIHLHRAHPMYDSFVFVSFAATALALGVASLLLVQFVVTRAAGALLGWLVAVGSILAASVGVYLGRVVRLNSWDVVQRPNRVLELVRFRLENPLGNHFLIAFVIAFSGFLMLVYMSVYGFTSLGEIVQREDG